MEVKLQKSIMTHITLLLNLGTPVTDSQPHREGHRPRRWLSSSPKPAETFPPELSWLKNMARMMRSFQSRLIGTPRFPLSKCRYAHTPPENGLPGGRKQHNTNTHTPRAAIEIYVNSIVYTWSRKTQ